MSLRLQSKPFALTIILLVVLSSGIVLAAAPGDLDPSFGVDGKVMTRRGGNAWGFGMAVQADGKILLAGRLDFQAASSPDFLLARYNRDGSLDAGFGSGGMVTVDFAGDWDEARSVAVQADGKIVVAGQVYRPNNYNVDAGLVRFNPDGTLDPTFGSGGKTISDLSYSDSVLSVAVQGDGKIVVGGDAVVSPFPGEGRRALLARYKPDGSLDPTFGSAGKVFTSFKGLDNLQQIALAPDGSIVAAGSARDMSYAHADWAIARYTSNGALDTSFGGLGYVLTDFGGRTDEAHALALQADGRIVAAGESSPDGDAYHAQFALARYLATGALDPSFGAGGTLLTSFDGAAQARAYVVAMQEDAKIVAVGNYIAPYGANPSGGFALVRYFPWGQVDEGFGPGGMQMTPFAGEGDEAHGVAVLPDGKILAGGVADERVDGVLVHDFALAQYMGDGANETPVLGPIDGLAAPIPANAGWPAQASASFTDGNASDWHTGTWDWGDGISSPAAITEQRGAGTASGSHTYTQAGTYAVTLTITDQRGGAAQSVYRYAMVYVIPNACTPGYASISTNFNATPIRAGSTIWFSSVVKVSGTDGRPIVIRSGNSAISFSANGKGYHLPVAKAVVSLTGEPKVTDTDFDGDTWFTTAPVKFDKPTFVAGLAFPVTEDLPGGINPVTWNMDFYVDDPGLNIEWKWAAAVYKTLPTDFPAGYGLLGVKPTDGTGLSPFYNGDHAGTPEYFKTAVIGGARGGGGSNYTGSYTGAVHVCR